MLKELKEKNKYDYYYDAFVVNYRYHCLHGAGCIILMFQRPIGKTLVQALMKKELDDKTTDGEKIVLTRIDEEKK